jgi:hypothetical protein
MPFPPRFPPFIGWAARDFVWAGLEPGPVTAPRITGVPSISGTPLVGSLLTAAAAPVSGSPAPATAWQWFRVGGGGVLETISGARAIDYLASAADAGRQLCVRQSASNALGTVHAVSAPLLIGDVGPPPDDDWLLAFGQWRDAGFWRDEAIWRDGA